MMTINPRHRPIRGVQAIADYLGQNRQLTHRQLLRGMIDADRDGKLYVTSAARIDNSPLIVGTSKTAA